jgi:hypothetical protein
MSNPPEWIIRHVQDARDLFGIGGPEWHIYVELNDRPNGSDSYNGFASVDYRYLNANIEFNRGLEDDEVGQQVIYHEVLHISHQVVDDVALDAINRLPEAEQEIYRQLYKDAVEQFIQRVSRSIVYRLRPANAEGEDDASTG